jgi:hypothetical protein
VFGGCTIPEVDVTDIPLRATALRPILARTAAGERGFATGAVRRILACGLVAVPLSGCGTFLDMFDKGPPPSVTEKIEKKPSED